MFPSLLKRAYEELSNRPELAIAGFKGSGLYPVDKSEPLKKVIRISEDEPLDSPRKAIQKVVREILSPAVDPDIASAIKDKRQKRKRVQAEAGEILTETAVERMRQEEVDRQGVAKTKGKASKGKVTKAKSKATHTVEDPDIAPKALSKRCTSSLQSCTAKVQVKDGEKIRFRQRQFDG